jgi:arabinofuranosyltransferase
MREFHRHCLLAALVVAAGAAMSRAALGDETAFGIDDANITHVYARNIAEGLGSVYYRGGAPVEGSTSTLWTLINAAIWVFAGSTPAVYQAIAILFSWASVLVGLRMWALTRDTLKLEGAIGEGVTALVFLCAPAWFAWTIWTLMDVTLWTALFGACVLATAKLVSAAGASRRTEIFALALHALLIACRPEGIAMSIGLLAVALLIVVLRQGGPDRSRLWSLVRITLAAGIVFSALTLARLAIFGQPFPNTYYAKVVADLGVRLARGATYTIDSILRWQILRVGLVCWSVLIAMRVWARRRDLRRLVREEGALLLLPAGLAGLLATSTLSGGDHFAYQRFFQPALPILAIGIAAMVAGFVPETARRSRALATGAAALSALMVWLAYSDFRFRENALGEEFIIANEGREMGERLNQIADTAGPTSLSVLAAGGIALTYRGGPVYDVLGLNWPEMAHSKAPRTGVAGHVAFDPAVFWRASPDLLVSSAVGRPAGHEVRVGWFEDLALKGLLRSNRFQAAYVPAEVDGAGRPRFVFVSHAWLERHGDAGGRLSLRSWQDVEIGRSEAANVSSDHKG